MVVGFLVLVAISFIWFSIGEKVGDTKGYKRAAQEAPSHALEIAQAEEKARLAEEKTAKIEKLSKELIVVTEDLQKDYNNLVTQYNLIGSQVGAPRHSTISCNTWQWSDSNTTITCN